MSVTGLDVFDTTVDKTNGGLKDLMEHCSARGTMPTSASPAWPRKAA